MKSFANRFFQMGYYSTAEKIIVNVAGKIILETQNHPVIIKTFNDYKNILQITHAIENERKLIQVLGDTLASIIPQHYYKKYQNLNESEKNTCREVITTEYFNCLKKYTDRLSRIEIKVTNGFDHRFGENIFISLVFPDEFTKIEFLQNELKNSINEVQKYLIEFEHEVFQFRNNSL